jgi:hypothetical protein
MKRLFGTLLLCGLMAASVAQAAKRAPVGNQAARKRIRKAQKKNAKSHRAAGHKARGHKGGK